MHIRLVRIRPERVVALTTVLADGNCHHGGIDHRLDDVATGLSDDREAGPPR